MGDELAIRPPVVEGDVVDVELDRLVKEHGVMGAIQIRMWLRVEEFPHHLMFVPGANPDLVTIDLDDPKAGNSD